MKKLIAILLIIGLVSSSVLSFAEETEIPASFNDITASWAIQEIEQLYKKGIINGVGDNIFAPDKEITRSEFLVIMTRVLKLNPMNYENIYPDVCETDWYASMLQAMYELSLIDKEGFGGSFSGDKPITREEMASFLVKGFEFYNGAVSTEKGPFLDLDTASSWSKGYIDKVVSLGIMDGKEENQFAPLEHATRAETAAVMIRLMKAFQNSGLDTEAMPWRLPPVVYQSTDEVRPNEVFSIFGYGLKKGTVIYMESDRTAKEEPGENAVIMQPLQYDDTDTHFVSALMPETLDAGVYKVWTKNEYGISNPIYLNAPRIFWFADSDIIFEGLTLHIIGTNFLGERFGIENNTAVKLKVSGQEYPCEVTQAEPYSLKVTVAKGIKTGKAEIFVTNNGITWCKLKNEQTLTITEKGEDPYHLGVGWAKNYKYDYKVNVKDFGAKGDGIADDTAAINTALQSISGDGGGILYFPQGTYNIVLF